VGLVGRRAGQVDFGGALGLAACESYGSGSVPYRKVTDESWSASLQVSQKFDSANLWQFGSEIPRTVESEDFWCQGFRIYGGRARIDFHRRMQLHGSGLLIRRRSSLHCLWPDRAGY
jgi:hypothetical protein